MSDAATSHTSAARDRGPLLTGGEVRLGTVDPALDELLIDVAVALQQRGHGHRQHTVGARAHGEVQIGAIGDRGASRVDDDQPRPGTPTLLDHRRQMGLRDVGIGTPHHDQVTVFEVLRVR